MNAIFTRRSVRKFCDKPVEPDKIEKLLRAAMQAPSASNQQPWEFIVVQGRENLDNLSSYNQYAKSLKTATAAIIILCNKTRFKFGEYWEQDLAAATQNILLQATEMGLGSVWYGTAPDKTRIATIQKMYELSENLVPFSVIGIGYPQDPNANSFVDRYDATRVKYIN